MKWFYGLALGLLASCGPLAQKNPVAGFAQGVVSGGGGGDDSAGAGLAGSLNREFIDAQPNDMMLVSVIAREATALVVRAGNNRSKATWFSADGISVTFENGVLVATRGLGADLMGADVSAVARGFAGSSNYMRTHSFMNGLDQVEAIPYACTMTRDRSETITIYERSYATNVFVEECSGGGLTIRNTYWRAENGVIWQARQWVSADVGYIGYQRL